MSEFALERHDVNGHQIVTREGGSGPTLLYLHGAGGAWGPLPGHEEPPFLTELARSFRVLVPEHPGFGESERPDWLDSVHDLAYFYLDYLKARDLGQVHLVGTSIGGWIALEIAVRDTSRLASLTLCGSAGIHVRGVPKGDIFVWSKEEMARRCLKNPKMVEFLLAYQPTPEQEFTILKNWQMSALLAWEPRLYDPDLHKWLHRIDVPTHVVWADEDEVFPKAYADAFVKLIGGARLTVIDQCGHFMHVDRPEAFCRAVGQFILEEAA